MISNLIHDSDNILHDTNPHFNILFYDNTKVRIITPP